MKFRRKWHTSCRMPTSTFLRWSSYLFVIIGVLALGYAGFMLVDAKALPGLRNLAISAALGGRMSPLSNGGEYRPRLSAPPSTAEANRANAESFPALRRGGSSTLGRIEIRAIGLAVMIMEGTDDETLRRGVGHIPGTALPGRGGNVALAGHRDTFLQGAAEYQAR